MNVCGLFLCHCQKQTVLQGQGRFEQENDLTKIKTKLTCQIFSHRQEECSRFLHYGISFPQIPDIRFLASFVLQFVVTVLTITCNSIHDSCIWWRNFGHLVKMCEGKPHQKWGWVGKLWMGSPHPCTSCCGLFYATGKSLVYYPGRRKEDFAHGPARPSQWEVVTALNTHLFHSIQPLLSSFFPL